MILHLTVICQDEEVSHSEDSYCCVMTYGGSPQGIRNPHQRQVVMIQTDI